MLMATACCSTPCCLPLHPPAVPVQLAAACTTRCCLYLYNSLLPVPVQLPAACPSTPQVYLYITPFSIPYLLFSVGIGYFKMWAMLSGLLGSEKSKSWKVGAGVRGAGTAADGCSVSAGCVNS
jgi:hypothetical protein